MKYLITILFLFSKAFATTYYVASAGNDINNGTTTGTPFLTITKAISVSVSGDNILLNKGDVWNEKITVTTSGTSGNIITFSSYGTGAKPIISGFQTLTGWTNVGNVWSSTFTNSVQYQNTVLIDGKLQPKGRYPNNSWLTITSHSGNNQITGSLTGTPNYTGGEVVIRNNKWTLDHLNITSQSGGTINFSPATYYGLNDGFGYFIQNIESVLDTVGEYAYDVSLKVIKVYATSLPIVKASAIDTLINICKKSYISFDGIQIEGANIAGICADSSSNIIVTNCTLKNMGQDAVNIGATTYLTISNNTFSNIFNDAVFTQQENHGSNIGLIISGNTFSNVGNKAGMGASRFTSYTGIAAFANKMQIINNRIDSIGYIALQFFGDSPRIENNVVSNFCFVKDDGGGIYTWMGAGIKHGAIVRTNIVFNGLTALEGTANIYDTATSGIYMDNETTDVLIDSNTVYNIPMAGIFLHVTHSITLRNNISYNCQRLLHIEIAENTILKENVFATPSASGNYSNVYLRYFPYITASDSNYYYNPYDSNKLFKYSLIGQNYSLKRWQDSTGFDLHSKRKPSGIISADPILKVNATTVAASYDLVGTYRDFDDNLYYGSITLQPYTSKVLFKNILDLIPPTIGVLRNLKFKRIVQ